jgi:hypothetical protein
MTSSPNIWRISSSTASSVKTKSYRKHDICERLLSVKKCLSYSMHHLKMLRIKILQWHESFCHQFFFLPHAFSFFSFSFRRIPNRNHHTVFEYLIWFREKNWNDHRINIWFWSTIYRYLNVQTEHMVDDEHPYFPLVLKVDMRLTSLDW